MEEYTDIIHIGMQVNILSRTIQGENTDNLLNEYSKYLKGHEFFNNLGQQLDVNGGTRNADGSTNL